MTDLPIHDLTPESPDDGHQRWGKDVTHAALAIIRREAPAATVAAVTEKRAFFLNVFGRDDLLRIDQWLVKYSDGGNQLLWQRAWNHPGAGRVATFVFLVPDNKTIEQVTAEKLGGSRA